MEIEASDHFSKFLILFQGDLHDLHVLHMAFNRRIVSEYWPLSALFSMISK